MAPRGSLGTALMGLALGRLASAQLATCGTAQYDPTQYVCYDNNFLCPIVAGEGLSVCNGACYSTFMYTCSNNVLALLPPASTPFTLTASNPTLPIDGAPVTASGEMWFINGTTASYCPDQEGVTCPPGDTTVIQADDTGGAAMDVEVPGGQLVYLNANWNVGYTQAHSATLPPGSVSSGFAAYQGGGFVNLNGNGWGWVACPPTTDAPWGLVAKNATNAANLGACFGVNLKVNAVPAGTIGAWEYE